MTTTDTGRNAAAAVLRAVAGLIETHPDMPEPSTDISFYVRGENTPATMAAIAAALPCQWRAEISRSGAYEWLYLRSDIPLAAVTRGTRVSVGAPAADACTAAGAKTVTVWQPAAALAALAARPGRRGGLNEHRAPGADRACRDRCGELAEEARQDRLVRAQIARDREAAREQLRITSRQAAADARRADGQHRAAARAQARKGRAARRAQQAVWARGHVVDLLFVPVIGVPAVLAWTAMAAYGVAIYGPAGLALPVFSEGAMWVFAAATTITRRRYPGRPLWHLRTGTAIFAGYGAALNFAHGLTTPGGPVTGAVYALVSVAGVAAHQLITAGPRRSRAEREGARLARAAARRERAARSPPSAPRPPTWTSTATPGWSTRPARPRPDATAAASSGPRGRPNPGRASLPMAAARARPARRTRYPRPHPCT